MRPRSRISGQIKRAEKKENPKVSFKKKRWDQVFVQKTQKDAKQFLYDWFKKKSWKIADFQKKSWDYYLKGHSGLISVPTGEGKTLAALGGPLIELMSQSQKDTPTPHIIYISPTKSLARNIAISLENLLEELNLPFKIYLRIGDTEAAQRRFFKKHSCDILITTPESLALLMTEQRKELAEHCRSIIVDEWHEFIETKRGSLLDLHLAELKRNSTDLKVWGMSATIGNLKEAAQVLTYPKKPKLVQDSELSQELNFELIIPEKQDDVSIFGFANDATISFVCSKLSSKSTQIIFTNTRKTAEVWFKKILEFKPEWESLIALHHGSLALERREQVEEGLRLGQVKVVVATSSLELGVDFPKVEKIYQVGSLKSLSRAVQRAGRALHQPGKGKNISLIPVGFFDLLEPKSLELAKTAGNIENKHPIQRPFDTLIQYILCCACNDGFKENDLYKNLKNSYAFQDLSPTEFSWCVSFVDNGGQALSAYPQYQKIECLDGTYRFKDKRLEREHKMNIGTIVDDMNMEVKFLRGQSLGRISEVFASKLQVNDIFSFAGKSLKLIQIRDAKLLVRLSKGPAKLSAGWAGAILSSSENLMEQTEQLVAEISEPSSWDNLDLDKSVLRLFKLQSERSKWPKINETLVEDYFSKEGHHIYIYTFAGSVINQGLGHILAYRISNLLERTISVSANDQGLELLSSKPLEDFKDLLPKILSTDALEHDLKESLNYKEMSRRKFREICRVSILTPVNLLRGRKEARHLQASASLLFDVFSKYDPDNLLIKQADDEVFQNQLDFRRIHKVLTKLLISKKSYIHLKKLSPFAVTLYLERIKSYVSSESLEKRLDQLKQKVFNK